MLRHHKIMQEIINLATVAAVIYCDEGDQTIATTIETFTANVEIRNAAGTKLNWLDMNLPIALTVTTAGDGTATLEGSITNVAISEGAGSFQINFADTWAADDTCVIKLGATSAGTTVFGKGMTQKVITLTAA